MEHLGERVEVAELRHDIGRLRHRQRVVAAEGVVAIPAHVGERLLEVLRELLGLPLQVHVVHELRRQVGELLALFGSHRIQHRRHGCHALGHDLEQLVERLGVLGEEIAIAIHESLEVGLLAAGTLFEHLVELGHHVLGAGQVLGAHVAHGTGHLVEVALGHFLAQPLDELVELLARLGRFEVVALQAAHLAGQVGGQHVELQVAFGGARLGDLVAALIAAVGRVVRKFL